MCRGMVRETKRFLSGIRRAVPHEEKGGFQGFLWFFSERYSAAQQRPFGAVREANCLEQVPLYRQFLKKGFV